jgi:hypothetical protein
MGQHKHKSHAGFMGMILCDASPDFWGSSLVRILLGKYPYLEMNVMVQCCVGKSRGTKYPSLEINFRVPSFVFNVNHILIAFFKQMQQNKAEPKLGEIIMETTILDRVFHCILKRMVETGQAPFYIEIAAELGLSIEEARKALHDLFSEMIPCWLFPDTDFITSFAPFNNLPTQYHLTVDGVQKWFGQ